MSETETCEWRIEGGRWMDPVTGQSGEGTLWLRKGRMFFHPPGARTMPEQVWDARGKWVVPALLDVHVHLREPGNDAAETIESGTRAATAGGFSAVVAMPNTRPPLDTQESVRFQIQRARAAGFAEVWPSACLTLGRAGEKVAPLEELAAAGAVAFTDDGCTVMNDDVLREAMRRAKALGKGVMDHAQDTFAEAAGCMHEGAVSKRFGLQGIPSDAEARIIERDIRLARETGCALHIQHISSREGVRLVAAARRAGLSVSAELTPHHLALCDEDMTGPEANWKMNPPIRGRADREALVEGILSGALTCFATDHAPHTAESKARGMAHAPFGVVGLETAVGVTYTELVKPGKMSLLHWLRAWTTGPAAVLGIPLPALAEGAPATLTVLDLDQEWAVDPAEFLSRSRNTPFTGRRLVGRSCAVFSRGRLLHPRVG